jgi:hypothetical protein
MKRYLCLVAIFTLSLFACRQEGQEGEVTPPPQEQQQPQPPEQQPQPQPGQPMGQEQNQMQEQLPPTEGQAFLQHIARENPYKKWQMWPGKGEMYPGTEPHGALLTTYVNDQALQAIQQKSGQMPDGAIVVKENYTPDKQLAAVTAMYKKQGFNLEAGDWYWIKLSPDGQIDEEGKVEGCISCHAKAQGNDFLFTGNIME